MSARVLFYVQHLLGVGHLKRSEVLAAAMAEVGLDVIVVLGGRPVPEAPFKDIRQMRLPPAQIANEDFSTIRDLAGNPIDDAWKTARRTALLEAFRDVDPAVLLIELYPFGRRQFAFELIPLLEAAKSRGTRIACSLRDILVASRKPGRDEEVAAIVRQYFDTVLVHGDPRVIPINATFPSARSIEDLIHYTGYVAGPSIVASAASAGEVIVSAGGGAVGGSLLDTAIAARPLTWLSRHVWRLITGPNLPAPDFERLAAKADAATIVERFREDFPARLGRAALSISQAGYNTTMDILRAKVKAVVVPYERGGETEQRKRSDLLQAQRLLTVVPAAELSPERLAEGIAAALALSPPEHGIDLDGAAKAATMIVELARRGQAAAYENQ